MVCPNYITFGTLPERINEGLKMDNILAETLDATAFTMTTVFLMLFLTGLMVEMGVFQRMSYLAGPLVSISHLPSVSASSLVISLGSALAANTMIARLRDEGNLSERQAFLSAVMNSVPVYFRGFFTYQLPFVIPVLGIFVGGVYAAVAIATGLIKLLLVVILGRAYLSEESSLPLDVDENQSKMGIVEAAKKSLRGQTRIFLRISALYISALYFRHDVLGSILEQRGNSAIDERPPHSPDLSGSLRNCGASDHLRCQPQGRNNPSGADDPKWLHIGDEGVDGLDAGKRVHASCLFAEVFGSQLYLRIWYEVGAFFGSHVDGHQRSDSACGVSGVGDLDLLNNAR
jgi:hypothetical protein